MIPTVKKETVNADPRTMAIKSEPIFNNNEPVTIKTEPIYEESQPLIDTKPLYIKTEPLTDNTPPAMVEIPFYNPLMTKISSVTPISTTSPVVSAGNSQLYSPSFPLLDCTIPPPAFNLPTSNFINPWKTDVPTNNEITEIDKFRETVAYPDIYNNNCQKDKFKDLTRDDFHVIRFRNPDNDPRKRSYWDDEGWDNPNSHFTNESSSLDNSFWDRRYSDYYSNSGHSNNRDNRGDQPYSKNFNERRWDSDAQTDNFNRGFRRNARFFQKRSFYNRSSRN